MKLLNSLTNVLWVSVKNQKDNYASRLNNKPLQIEN